MLDRYDALYAPRDSSIEVAAGPDGCDLAEVAAPVAKQRSWTAYLLMLLRQPRRIRLLAGKNAHHATEAIFKALARALSDAISIDPRGDDSVPSTKGML